MEKIKMYTIDELRDYFSKDKFATEAMGAVIDEVGENYAKVSLRLDGRHRNARGEVMGGVYYTLADFAFAVATNTPEKETVSTVCQITFLRPIKGDVLTAETRLTKEGRSLCYYTVDLWDDLGSKVASVSMSGMHLEKR